MAKIIDIEGVGEAYAKKLESAGIRSVEALLKAGATPKGRAEIADKCKIDHALLLRWVNHADLFRIKGVGSEYAELLEAAGVDTVRELAQRKAANLVERLAAANKERAMVRRLPVESEVARWIEEAKKLPRVVTY